MHIVKALLTVWDNLKDTLRKADAYFILHKWYCKCRKKCIYLHLLYSKERHFLSVTAKYFYTFLLCIHQHHFIETNSSKPEGAAFYRPENAFWGSIYLLLWQRTPFSFIYSQTRLYIFTLYTETPLYREQNSEQISQSNLICLHNHLF